MKDWKKSFWFITFIGILIGTASWALYRLINMATGDLLSKIGVMNEYYQAVIVIIIVVVILFVAGYGGKKIIKRITD